MAEQNAAKSSQAKAYAEGMSRRVARAEVEGDAEMTGNAQAGTR